MKLYFLGTCAGTEPMPDRKHASLALEVEGDIYWFDAGEGCSYTAHNLGVDVLKVKTVVISHPHLDHTGGLANLIWNIRKMHWVKNSKTETDIDIWLPDPGIWEAVKALLRCSEGQYALEAHLLAHGIRDGVLFDTELCGLRRCTISMLPRKRNNGGLSPFSWKPKESGWSIPVM